MDTAPACSPSHSIPGSGTVYSVPIFNGHRKEETERTLRVFESFGILTCDLDSWHDTQVLLLPANLFPFTAKINDSPETKTLFLSAVNPSLS